VLPGSTMTLPGWIRLQLIGVELAAETDVENAGDHCIDTILQVSVRHQLYAVGTLTRIA
jgi:hypothetical protein